MNIDERLAALKVRLAALRVQLDALMTAQLKASAEKRTMDRRVTEHEMRIMLMKSQETGVKIRELLRVAESHRVPRGRKRISLLTTRQAAERLGISPKGVHKLVQRGQLRAVPFGNALAFTPADVDRAKGRPAPGRPAAAGGKR